jgi:hypothetical protein
MFTPNFKLRLFMVEPDCVSGCPVTSFRTCTLPSYICFRARVDRLNPRVGCLDIIDVLRSPYFVAAGQEDGKLCKFQAGIGAYLLWEVCKLSLLLNID